MSRNGQRCQPVKWVFIGFLVLTLNSGYLAAFSEPSFFYMANVLLHVALGVALVIPFFIFVRRFLQNDAPKGSDLAVYTGRIGYWFLTICMLSGLYLVVVGATKSQRWILYFHIVTGLLGVAFFQKSIRSVAHKVSTNNPFDVAGRLAWVAVVVALCVPVLVGIYRMIVPDDEKPIVNPATPPAKMEDQAMLGATGPFYPSAVATSTQEKISAKAFLNSASCGQTGCHPDIYQQWQSSAHHYSSLNNPWYRRTAEYLQELAPAQAAHSDTSKKYTAAKPEKWCSGCHDPALLVSGMIEQPRQELAKAPEAHAGISCTACHSIVQVKSTMGQADYIVEEMPLNEWATSENKLWRELYNFLLRIDPAPHRKAMLKSFHRNNAAEFCSSCHKAHLDQPVNQFRWIRSFNDYDAWQAGPFSGRSSRSFYLSPEPKNCVDCHMPLTPSSDAGSIDGKIHDHRFLGGNTALPVVNQDQEQLQATTAFLRDHRVSVDIFALGKPYDEQSFHVPNESYTDSTLERKWNRMPPLATHFAIGDEQPMPLSIGGLTKYPSEVIAPINQSNATISRGEEVRIDVVVRSRQVGHFFPSGTVDAHDAWLELKAVDDSGKIVFWSGAVADQGKGPVEPGAHFYRSYLVDGHGNHIDKNNTWDAHQAVYVNLISPGGAEVVHYRLRVPSDCGDKLHLTAKLNYRKFSWWYTQWVFAGLAGPKSRESDPGTDIIDGPSLLKGLPYTRTAEYSSIPEVPIVEMARDEITLAVSSPDKEKPSLLVQSGTRDWERWNDYGIGLLLQGDLKSAEAAFLRVSQIAQDYPDAWVNVGITRLQEGRLEEAKAAFETAMKMDADLIKAHYYYGLTLKAQRQYDEALKYLKKVVAKFPRDRVARNVRGHLYLLMQNYARAIRDFQKVLGIDPENVEAHYYLMRAYRATGEEENAKRAEAFYLRFRSDDRTAFAESRKFRDQNTLRERQPIHEHLSVTLPFGAEAAALTTTGGKARPGER
ncbi:MAG: tetratricopeptide repeat protein [candidate division KSB1 bacterium]|nr:tetratricopeptide repeat protein [candidate division KSB1 bacterium]MDZ7302283.1 tetratricopeptide repeat protein [candidate division KSB1 bacterium]MDZ7311389.1 tetratricopeptide repeat protein [candidate division KSB1 bacterium]